jgi:hypothetical protein
MPTLSAGEERLLAYITDHSLRTSLSLLRQASEHIWHHDAPRIIKDYTDHGIHHLERIAQYSSQLLPNGFAIKEAEAYALLASLYLHDIGMQCDVIAHPHIKSRAAELGATFEIDFTTTSANTYSVAEHKAIRQNHHYLSIAWIDVAFHTGNTTLGLAAKTIPPHLVKDIMDICVHHTKLPLTSCPATFTVDSTCRKQFIAALFRLSDELDIESTRVSLDTVTTFSISPLNAVYWWIHTRTTLVFKSPCLLRLVISLHPDDAAREGVAIHRAFITEFRTKNAPVLSILAQYGLPVVIDDDSQVIPLAHAERLPHDIVAALFQLKARRAPLLDLAEEVKVWLTAIHLPHRMWAS